MSDLRISKTTRIAIATAVVAVIAIVIGIALAAQGAGAEAQKTPAPVVTIDPGSGTPTATPSPTPSSPSTSPETGEGEDAEPEEEVIVGEHGHAEGDCGEGPIGCADEEGYYAEGDEARVPALEASFRTFMKVWFTTDRSEKPADRTARLKQAGAVGSVLSQPSVFQRTGTRLSGLTGFSKPQEPMFVVPMGRVGGNFAFFASVPVNAEYRQADGTGTDFATSGTIQVSFDDSGKIVNVVEQFTQLEDLP